MGSIGTSANLESLSLGLLSRNQFTDDGIAHLSRLSRLRTLRLGNCEITDAGLAHFSDLVMSLEELAIELHPMLRQPDLGS